MISSLEHLTRKLTHRPYNGGEIKLTHTEVQALFRVDSATVNTWVKEGKLSRQLSLFGSRQYREDEIKGLLADPPVQN